MNKKLSFLPVLIALICMAFTSTAMADNTPIPGTMTATSSAYMTGMATKDITVKTWVAVAEHIRIQKVSPAQCQWFATFWNSDYLLGQTSHMPYMYIDHNGYLCRDKYSPSGWVKRGGGHTGLDCRNIAAPMSAPKPHYKVMPPPSIELKHATALHVWVNVTVNATANVQLWCGLASGNGSASDKIRVNYLSYIRANGAAKLELFLQVAIKAADSATANANVSCTYTPPTSTPPTAVCTDTTATNFGSPLPCQYPPPCTTNCGPPPPPPSIVIVSRPTENMIPAGKNSGPLDITVNASDAGGSLTIDPSIGGVSSCSSTIPEASITFAPLASGNTTECFVLYAPNDAAQPSTMSVTYTATLGSAMDQKTDTFGITYPTPPS